MVEDGIYRCSKLDAINISFLKSLELRSIVWINEEKPPRVLRQFIEEHSIRLFHMMNSSVLPEEDEITNLKYQEWMVLKPSLISKSIEIILDVTNQNCLVMDKSEVIVGILRHIQRWNYSSISNEYRLYASRASYKVEIFLELINIELLPHGVDTIEEKEKEKEKDRDKEKEQEQATQKRRDTLPLDVGTPTEDPRDNKYDVRASHSSSKAISIQRDSATSPALRRLSIEYNGLPGGDGVATPSPPLSSSVGRLSISTSPQIPKNLLKIVEMRKNKKKHIMELREKEKEKEESRSEPLFHSESNSNTNLSPPSPLKNLSPAVDGYRWPAAPPSPFALPPASSSSASSTDGAPPASASDSDNAAAAAATGAPSQFRPFAAGDWKLYKPRMDGTHVRRHGHAGRPPRPVLTAIRVQLPPETCLPAWFLGLRALCER